VLDLDLGDGDNRFNAESVEGSGGELTVRHSTTDVSRTATLANLQALALEVESSSLKGVEINVVALNAGGSVLMRSSSLQGGGLAARLRRPKSVAVRRPPPRS